MFSKLKAISYYLPENILSNAQIVTEFPEWSIEKIESKVGIKQRHIAAHDEFVSDMAVRASQKLFLEHDIDPKTIDFVLLCTQSPDYFLPTTACIVQNLLSIPTSAGALDFNLGCSGYVYGLGLAKGLIETQQAANVLLITAETYTKHIHPKDKSVRTVFGDAASASLVSANVNNLQSPKIYGLVYGTDGRGAENLIVKRGAMRQPNRDAADFEDEFGNTHNENNLYMNGAEIFVFTLKNVPKLVRQILDKTQLTFDDIDLFVFHQANQYMLEALRHKLKIPEHKFFVFVENCANTVSSTIPISLHEALKQKKIKQGDKVLLAGFGVGYSWAGAVVEF